jgi:hypothetical protein
MTTIVSASRGIGVPKYKECSGPGTDAVQEETGELDYYSIIDIIFHEDTVPNLRFFYEQAGLRASRSARSGLAARPWLGDQVLRPISILRPRLPAELCKGPHTDEPQVNDPGAGSDELW